MSWCEHCRPAHFTPAMSHRGDMTHLLTAAFHRDRMWSFSSHQRSRTAFIQTQTFHSSQINTQTFTPNELNNASMCATPVYTKGYCTLSFCSYFFWFACALETSCIHKEPSPIVERESTLRLFWMESFRNKEYPALFPKQSINCVVRGKPGKHVCAT